MAKGADKSSGGETSKTTILRIAPNKRKNFSILGNAMLQDKNLGNEALGVLAFILSHPEDWRFEIEWLCRERDLGRDKARRIIGEVISAGYCHRVRPRNSDGTLGAYEYVFSGDPEVIAGLASYRKPGTGEANLVQPVTGLPITGEPGPGKPVDYNKEDSSTKKQTNSESEFDLEGKGVRDRLRYHHAKDGKYAAYFRGVAFARQNQTVIATAPDDRVRRELEAHFEPHLLAACKAEWSEVTAIKIVSNDNVAGAAKRAAT